MDRKKLKAELERLVAEAPRIAPSITRLDERRTYGSVTDENLDIPSSVRWELEAAAALEQLADSGTSVFKGLHTEYLSRKEASKRFHSRSILIHKVVELLESGIQLLDSALSEPISDAARRSNLSAWPVIRGILLRLSSYEVPGVIDRAGLIVDWSLTERENYSHSTRLAAYRPRIDAAYQSLPSDDDRLRVVYIVARELATRGSTAELNRALRDIGWEFTDCGLTAVGSTVRELFSPEQSQHDAYVEIRAILQKAKHDITIVDPYIDQSILTLLSACAAPGMTIRLLTSRAPSDFVLEAQKWLAQHSGCALEVRTTREFHDRFIVLDNSSCWHVGRSIKDAGRRAFMLSDIEDDDNRLAMLQQLSTSWTAGTRLS